MFSNIKNVECFQEPYYHVKNHKGGKVTCNEKLHLCLHYLL